MNGKPVVRGVRLETNIIGIAALATLLVHLLTNHRYGYFRDELYFIACTRHLDFGYVDLAPLSILLLRFELAVFGSSLTALRLFPALAGAAMVAFTGLFARELGGRAWAVALASVGAAGSLFYLAIGNFYSLNVYEPLLWTGCAYLLVRIVNRGSALLWLGFGIVAGLGLQNKHSIVFFIAALLLGMLLTSARLYFTQQWVWLGGVVALLIALPNIIWQINHGWPTWVLLRNVAASNKNVVLTPLQFIAQQVLLMNPATLPLWLSGLVWLLGSEAGRPYRMLGFAYLIALTEFIVMRGKNYYLGPIYPMLFAAGGLAWEGWFAARLRWLRPTLAAVIILAAVGLAPIVLPILPPEKLLAYMRAIHFQPPRTETSHTADLPQLFADQFGWEEMVRSVARVYESLDPEEQRRAGIFCQNYGQAGAIDLFGPKYGLPKAISGHQNYFLWGPRNYTGEIVIVLDGQSTDERRQFSSVQDHGLAESSRWAMPWEQRQHILVCRGLHGTLRELWPQVRTWL